MRWTSRRRNIHRGLLNSGGGGYEGGGGIEFIIPGIASGPTVGEKISSENLGCYWSLPLIGILAILNRPLQL